MKKVFQIKLKSIAKVFTLVVATSLVTFTGCKSYDGDITDLQGQIDKVVTDVATLKTSVAALQTSVSGMTYIKSITMGTDGKLTITPSTGSAIVYDAKNYVTYDIALTNNVLTVNGVNKGTVAIPALTFGADNKLMSGTTVVADLSSWVRTLTLSSDNYLMINGVKSTILIPAATVQSVDVKGITISGNVLTITKNDNSTSTITLPQTALTLTAVSSNNGELTLNLNGVDTKVTIKNTYAVVGGFLTVNGVATTVAIPAENKTSVIFSKDGNGNIISATISDGKDTFVVKVNPSNEALVGLLFAPMIINGGVNAVELGYIMDIATTPVKALFNQQEVTFRYNPFNANITDGITWSYVSNTAKFSVAPGVGQDKTDLFFAPTAAKASNVVGAANFDLKVNNWVETGAADVNHLFMLQATRKDIYSGKITTVVSDYVKVMPVQYSAAITRKGTSFLPFINANGNFLTSKADATANTIDVNLVYNNPNTNLNDLVVAAGAKGLGLPSATLEALGFGTLANGDYKFAFDSIPTAQANIGIDNVTKQSHFMTWDAQGNIIVKGGTSSINRVPFVKVSLLSKAGKLLAVSYIKFKINATELIKPTPKEFAYTLSDINYQTMFNGAASWDQDLTLIGGITWPQMNAIYTQLGIDHNKFLQIYGGLSLGSGITASGKYGSTAYTAAQLPQLPSVATQVAKLNITLNQPNVDTYAFSLEANPLSKFGANEFSFVLTPSVADQDNYPVITLKFNYNVIAPNVVKALLPAWQDPTGSTNATTQGTNVGGDYKMQLYVGEPFGYGDAKNALKAIFGATKANDKIDAKHELIVSEYTGKPVADPTSYIVSGNGQTTDIDVLLGTAPGSGALLKLANAITTTRVYPINFKTTYPNNEVNNFNFTITFKNPLEIALASDASFVLTDKQDGTSDSKDIALNYVVKFLGTTIVNKGANVANTFGLTNAGLAYSLTGITNDYKLVSLTVPSTVVWSNAGGALLIQKVDVANANVTYTAVNSEGAYAIQKRTDAVSVKPWNQ